jgi:hypothetical protein
MGSSALEEAVRSGSAGERERWGAGALGSGGAGERGRIWTRSVKPQAAWDPQRRLAASVYEAWGCEAWGCEGGLEPGVAPGAGAGAGGWPRESGPGNLAPGIWRLAGADWPGQADDRGA